MSDDLKKVMSDVAALRKEVAAIARHLGITGASASSNGSSGGARLSVEGEVAPDRDLDSSYGNPVIKYMPKPKYWPADRQDFTSHRFSETTPDFLDAMAKYLDACAYMAGREPDEKSQKSASYKRKDAARARGWAKRLREGWGGAAPAASDGGDFDPYGAPQTSEYDDMDVPF